MQLRRDHEPVYIPGLMSFLAECKEADFLAVEGASFMVRLEDGGMWSIFDDSACWNDAPLAA